MGKGTDDPNCSSSVGMSMADMLVDPAAMQLALLGDKSLQQQSQVYNAKLSSDKTRSRDIELAERRWAEDTLDHAERMRTEGRDEKDVNAYFSRRARMASQRRGRDLRERSDMSSDQGRELKLASHTAQVINATASVETFDPIDHPGLKFQQEFMNSEDFLDNLRKVIAKQTAEKGKAVANKDMEDAYRDAALLTVGIYDSQETVGSWTAENGTQYHIEVLREFSETALMDLIMLARPVDGSQAGVYTMQWKSYKTTSAQGSTPTPGAERNVRSVKIAKLTDLPDKDKHSLDALSREVQVRFLATNTFADTTAYNQVDQNGESQLITHSTRLSMPEVHRAISRAKDLPSLFRPAEKGDGKYGFMEARLETKNRDGQPVQIRILTQISAKIGANDKPERRGGRCLVDEADAAGINKGKISIDISLPGWHKLHKLSCFSKSYAQVIARHPEKLEQLGISLD